MYCISPYPVPMGARVSHNGNQRNKVNSLENGSMVETKRLWYSYDMEEKEQK